NLTDYIITDAPLEVQLQQSESGASWGTIANSNSLLRAAETLIDKAKAEAIAVVARFPDDEGSTALELYRYGQGVDPLAGAEAVISHLIVKTFQVPCAHAPALLPLPLDPNLSPRSAAEEIGYTFLPCVLVGLSRAPQLVNTKDSPLLTNTILAKQVDAVVVPATACGGSAVMSFSQTPAQIIAVRENQTQMQASPESLGIKALEVNSYLEALGVLVAHRAGINPEALRPEILPIAKIQ
ncbi:MAG: DUF3326 domain-containing protein, partial [Okeania sp. SIO3B3]|nr:DUF3326 domain-containing protein [Okeania sp. SIO3B3]